MKSFLITTLLCSLYIASQAQFFKARKNAGSTKKVYFALGNVAPLFSTAYYKSIDTVKIFSTLRVGYAITPIEAHYNFSKRRGIFADIALLNNGIAERNASIRYRERTISAQLELNAKIGNLSRRKYWHAGLGAGLGLQFRHEHWSIGQRKTHTHVLKDAPTQDLAHPFPINIIFGRQGKRIGWKMRYELTNFYNPNFTGNNQSVMHVFKQANILSWQLGLRI